MAPAAENRRTIVVADDEDHLRELVQATLEGPEYRILVAESGGGVLGLVDSEAVDLVILDWMMPEMAGIDVLRELASRPDATATIMLTARGAEKDIALAKAAGALHYLVKPFSPLELLEKVREVLAKSLPCHGRP